MQNETRVNLKHLLEDIRDSYSSPVEEVILTELVANALDSKATRFDVVVSPSERFLRVIDNGAGMKRAALREYHNIAASTKARGAGIGFAGIGAKLSLLVADRVVTESKGGQGTRAATEWRLSGPFRAPWKFVPFEETISASRGTSVTLYFADERSPLLDPSFVREALIRHFYPLFHERLHQEILRYIYKKGVQFTVNGELVAIPAREERVDHAFVVRLGRARRPIGAGFISQNVLAPGWLGALAGKEPHAHHLAGGLAIATYGKVIKGGWEWLGVAPTDRESFCGVVEVPAMAELLTTNKSDFLTDAVHLRKFYKLRRAVAEAVTPILRQIGQYGSGTERKSNDANMRPLSRTLEAALERVADDFPELAPLLATRRGMGDGKSKSDGKSKGGSESDNKSKSTSNAVGGKSGAGSSAGSGVTTTILDEDDTRVGSKKERDEKGQGGRQGTRKRPGLTLELGDLADAPLLLGVVREETIIVNTLHPAWKKALATKQEEYHIVLVTALSLSEYLDPEKNPQHFLERLLLSWSEVGEQKKLL